jgi:hypothetical protein
MMNSNTLSVGTTWVPSQVWNMTFSRTTDIIIWIMLFLMGLPETVIEKTYIGEIPLSFLLFYLAAGCAVIEFALAGGVLYGRSRILVIAALLFTMMAIMGLVEGSEFKWWAIDISMYSGLLLGLFWGKQRSIDHAARMVCRWNATCSLLLLVNVLGLYTGLIPPSEKCSDRILTYAMFDCANIVSISFPFCFAVIYSQKFQQNHFWMKLFLWLGGLSVLGAAFLSATRSVLIVGLASGVSTCWFSMKNRVLAGILFTMLIFFAWFLLSGYSIVGYSHINLLDRLLNTEIREEGRFEEVEMMFDDMQNPTDIWLGRGFGCQFLSNVKINGESVAFSPHISILTTWYKGGLLSFLVIILCPMFVVVYRLFMLDRPILQSGCYTGVVIYLILSNLSGGWNFIMLFVYGAFFALSRQNPKDFVK